MPYRTRATPCVVRLIPLRRLSAATLAQCAALRREAGRCWTDLMAAHEGGRSQRRWRSVRELEQLGAAGGAGAGAGGAYALHSQTIQALAQKLDANRATATELRKQEAAQGAVKAAYPDHPRLYQTVIGKDHAIQLQAGHVRLANGAKRAPRIVALPEADHQADSPQAELTWRADHDERCLTFDTGRPLPLPQAGGEVAGVDLGAVQIAAITTTRRQARGLCGRRRRACQQGRHRAHSIRQEKLSRCERGSQRARRLSQRQAQVAAKRYRQQRALLHQAAHQALPFCQAHGVSRRAVGEGRDSQAGGRLGRQANQTISHWPPGQVGRSRHDNAQRVGLAVEPIDERSSSRTCSHRGHVHPSSPRGRRLGCTGCGARLPRDVNGSATICSKAADGRYGQVQAETVRYLRPIVVVPRHRPQ